MHSYYIVRCEFSFWSVCVCVCVRARVCVCVRAYYSDKCTCLNSKVAVSDLSSLILHCFPYCSSSPLLFSSLLFSSLLFSSLLFSSLLFSSLLFSSLLFSLYYCFSLIFSLLFSSLLFSSLLFSSLLFSLQLLCLTSSYLILAMFPATNFMRLFGIIQKMLDGNTKMCINSKNVH